MEERIYTKTHKIKDRLKKNKRKNFDSVCTPTPSNRALSQSQTENEGLPTVLPLAEEMGVFSLEEVLEHRVTEECLSLFEVNGSMRKTTKCKIVDHSNMFQGRFNLQV